MLSLCVFLLACLTLTIGCAETLPATVSGKITIDGNDIPSTDGVTGNVVFYPISGGAAAFGSIAPGGKYNVSTGTTKGLEPGEYKVTVRVVEIPPEPEGGFQSAPPQKLLSPPRYSDNDKTDLKVLVEPGSNNHNFDLASNG